MADMYKKIDELLKQRGISGAKLSHDLGMSRSFMTELRKGRAKGITLDTAKKIADYFGISVAELAEDGPAAPNGASAPPAVEDIKFALFGGSEDITDEMYEEVCMFAKFVKQREARKNKE